MPQSEEKMTGHIQTNLVYFVCHYEAQNHLDEEEPAKPKQKLTPAPLNVEFLLEMFFFTKLKLSVLVFF